MAEAVTEQEMEKQHGPNSWLNEVKFTKAFMMHSVGQRIPNAAIKDASDAYRAVMGAKLRDEEKKWVLEAIATAAGRPMGVGGLVRQSREMLKALT